MQLLCAFKNSQNIKYTLHINTFKSELKQMANIKYLYWLYEIFCMDVARIWIKFSNLQIDMTPYFNILVYILIDMTPHFHPAGINMTPYFKFGIEMVLFYYSKVFWRDIYVLLQ